MHWNALTALERRKIRTYNLQRRLTENHWSRIVTIGKLWTLVVLERSNMLPGSLVYSSVSASCNEGEGRYGLTFLGNSLVLEAVLTFRSPISYTAVLHPIFHDHESHEATGV
nr:hypothetical protein CFP56_66505 [Quercus suber]